MTEDLSRREKERLLREAEIVAAAESVFIQKGFETASMDEIAQKAQFTKRTVYQYFPSKEDLFYAVAAKGFKLLFSQFEAAIAEGKTGFEKIRRSGEAYYQFCREYPPVFHLLNSCPFMKTNQESCPGFQEMVGLRRKMFAMFAAAIEQGKQDGSIRSDLDAVMGAYAVTFLSIGFYYMLFEVGMGFNGEPIDREEFSKFGAGLVLDAIRGRT